MVHFCAVYSLCEKYIRFFDKKRVKSTFNCGIVMAKEGNQMGHDTRESCTSKIISAFDALDSQGQDRVLHFLDLLAEYQESGQPLATVREIISQRLGEAAPDLQ